ncbi:MAG: hypothetical protein H0T73_03890 [Ardenticatenales bacterium]|nr:hypothetical protein [Ardenticatenales bacterium]
MGKTMQMVCCFQCGIEFERAVCEVNRAEKSNWRIFCSRNCRNLATPPPYPKGRMPPHLKPGNKRDEFTPFRIHLRLAKKHSLQRTGESQECSITLADLKGQWDSQQGICPYTGWELDNPISWDRERGCVSHAARASLDRIDSSKGYVVGNIQFVAIIANFAKHGYDESVFLEFCKAVVEYRNLVS